MLTVKLVYVCGLSTAFVCLLREFNSIDLLDFTSDFTTFSTQKVIK